MVTADQYVTSVLQRYAVPTGSYSQTELTANQIIPLIRTWAGQYLSTISFSGSYAKGTGVRGTTDIDLFVSMRSDTPGSLGELYNSLFNFAYQKGWQPRQQNVSIGIQVNGVDIDLVPARIQAGYQNYHSLYRRKADSWTQTNVALHIQTVKNSNRTQEIRAIKIWRMLHKLEFPSLYLELIVIDSLKHRRYGDLANNVFASLDFIANNVSINPGWRPHSSCGCSTRRRVWRSTGR